MGNEASRGLSPGGGALPPSPHVRRAKSFSSSSSSSPADGAPPSSPQLDRSIQRMDKTIRRRVRGGITYNMKIILRGDRSTGKTSLFQRLRGAPIPETHEPTPQLQSATINWSFRANSEEAVKCDVWDVVDKGQPLASPDGEAHGPHFVATVDATTVDVYHETHGVVFLLDVTKPHTLEYVRQQLELVPVHIPTLVLGNFRDCGAHRKIFKEDIQELLYGGPATPVGRRPLELLYFECSLLNCYGLKSLHQYFGIPFLQLKQQTIRQQLRILEGEFTHLKHDLQAKISEQKYADYLEHIKASGSDIRTGRRVAAAASNPPTGDAPASDATAHGETQLENESPTSTTRLDRTLSSSSDIVVHSETTTASASSTTEAPSGGAVQTVARQVELEDLPERTAALAQAGNTLKIDYTAEERQASKLPSEMPPLPGMALPVSSTGQKENAGGTSAGETPASGEKAQSQKAQASATATPIAIQESDAPMNLEDFQVPKPRYGNDLDSFYSDEESEQEADGDDDVVISSASARLAKAASAKYHKQQFLDSDDSDSEAERRSTQLKAPTAPPSKQRSPRRHLTKPSVEETPPPVGGSVAATNGGVMPPLPSPVRPPSTSGSPHSPTSPPRPTASPQHSPRRRVKEIQSSDANESHGGEQPSETVPVNLPPVLPEQDQAPSVAPLDQTTPRDDDLSTPEHAANVGECAVESVADVHDELAIQNVEPADDNEDDRLTEEAEEEKNACATHANNIEETESIENTQSAEDNEDETPSVDESVRDDNRGDGLQDTLDLDATELHSAPEEIINGSLESDASSSGAGTADVASHAIDEVDEVVPVAAGKIESFFCENDDEEEEGKSSIGDVTSVVAAETSEVDDREEPVEPSTSPIVQDPASTRNHKHSDSEDEVKVARSSGIVSQLKHQGNGGGLTLTDDDSDDTPDTPNTADIRQDNTTTKSKSTTRGRKVEILLSDSEDSDTPPPQSKPVEAPLPTRRAESSMDLTSIPSPPLMPAVPHDSSDLGDILESFLNDSGSDDDVVPKGKAVAPQTVINAVEDSDEEDEGENDRFAAYDMKRSIQRRSKTSRRKHQDDFGTSNNADTATSLSSSQTSSFSATGESTTRPSAFANQDVLAAIRAAELDALKMLEASTPLPSRASATAASVNGEESVKKKKSSSRSSSRRAEKEEANGDDAVAKKKKSKKKKDRESGSTSRSKRREVILTDEDE